MKRKTEPLAPTHNLSGIDEELREFQNLLETEMEAKLRESVLSEEHTRRRLALMEQETFRQVEAEWTEKQNILSRREEEIREEAASFSKRLKGLLAVSGDLEILLENTWTELTGGVLP